MYMYVSMYVTVYVGGCMHTYGQVHVCVRACGLSKVGTNECMFNTSRTHVRRKKLATH